MITIVDYGVGNIASLVNMLDFVGAKVRVSGNPEVIARAPKLLLPGVGSFAHAMSVLVERGLKEALLQAAGDGNQLLGVCLGMQLLGGHSEEGDSEGLGLIDGAVTRLNPQDSELKVPNIGWHEIHAEKTDPLLDGVEHGRFYHVHTYHMRCDNPGDVLATIDYGGQVTVAVARGRIRGVQFHPEKSHRYGMAVLRNFAAMP